MLFTHRRAAKPLLVSASALQVKSGEAVCLSCNFPTLLRQFGKTVRLTSHTETPISTHNVGLYLVLSSSPEPDSEDAHFKASKGQV